MKYFSIFTGAAGFEIGINKAYENITLQEQVQIQRDKNGEGTLPNNKSRSKYGKPSICIGMSEIDKYACQVLKYQFPNTKNYGNIENINWSEVPDFDLLVGGSPCQDFSIAGKRKGILGERSGLAWEFIRCLKEKKPQYFIWENVKGVLSSRKGFDFANLLTAFSEVGYALEWEVLNAKNFGVPQNRERIFLVGHLGNECRSKVFPIGQCDQGINGSNEESPQTNIARTVDTRTGSYPKWGQYIKQKIKVVGTLDEGTWSKRNESIRRVYGTDGLAPTIPTGTGGGVMPKLSIPVSCVNKGEKVRQNGRRFKTNNEPQFTLNTIDRQGIYNGNKIRRLTPTECMRLMSWPDDWCDWGIDDNGNKVAISDSQKYRMAGNGVVSNVVQAIMEKLIHTT